MNSPKSENSVTQTETLAIGSGTIAYEVMGSGPLVVMSHGVADNRSSFRFLAPLIAAAGYRVANVDLRGARTVQHGLGFLQPRGIPPAI